MKHMKITLNGIGMLVICYMEIAISFKLSSSFPFQYTATAEQKKYINKLKPCNIGPHTVKIVIFL